FDDGFSECYHTIAPILDEFNIKATFFLTEKCIDNQDMIWRNKLLFIQSQWKEADAQEVKQKFREAFQRDLGPSLLKSSNDWPMAEKDAMADFLWQESHLPPLAEYLDHEKPYLSEQQVFSLMNRGHHIGSHTYSHPFCGKLTKPEIDFEIIESAERLSQRFSFDCELFSYPFGSTVSPEMERYVLDHSRLKILFGIEDDYDNKRMKPRWERIVMEKTFDDSLYSFYVTPNIRKLSATGA
ncbi:MAG: polysaccharide deacetylase family protein, partial [Bacteroidota bacterium]